MTTDVKLMSDGQDNSTAIRGANKHGSPVIPVVYIENAMKINVLLHHIMIILYTVQLHCK